ncbi:MAG: hypothetical protein L0323_02560 [Planctomycetes bacterium]|nr:hypothetical protein [Planctomycetota bacterium]
MAVRRLPILVTALPSGMDSVLPRRRIPPGMRTARRTPQRGRGLTRQEREICNQIRRHAGKFIAVTREWTRIVAVGKTWRETHEKAIDAGFPDAPVFRAARDYTWVGHCLGH